MTISLSSSKIGQMYQQVFELHAKLLRAMAQPRRLEIVHLLRDQALSVAQMQQMLGLPQANLSQHLMTLREAGVVKFTKKGKRVFYRLAHENFSKTSDLIREILTQRYRNDKTMANELSLKMQDLVPIVKDPVCGMRVSPKTAAYAEQRGGKVFYFCAAGCWKKFKKEKSL